MIHDGFVTVKSSRVRTKSPPPLYQCSPSFNGFTGLQFPPVSESRVMLCYHKKISLCHWGPGNLTRCCLGYCFFIDLHPVCIIVRVRGSSPTECKHRCVQWCKSQAPCAPNTPVADMKHISSKIIGNVGSIKL